MATESISWVFYVAMAMLAVEVLPFNVTTMCWIGVPRPSLLQMKLFSPSLSCTQCNEGIVLLYGVGSCGLSLQTSLSSVTKCAATARKVKRYVQLYSDWQVISRSTRLVYCSLLASLSLTSSTRLVYCSLSASLSLMGSTRLVYCSFQLYSSLSLMSYILYP